MYVRRYVCMYVRMDVCMYASIRHRYFDVFLFARIPYWQVYVFTPQDLARDRGLVRAPALCHRVQQVQQVLILDLAHELPLAQQVQQVQQVLPLALVQQVQQVQAEQAQGLLLGIKEPRVPAA